MSETGRLIAETGIRPSKSKGQNFLTDGRVADRHIGYADICPGDRVLEVGPGLGILTQRLVEIADDLTDGCRMSEFSEYRDEKWEHKYIYCDYRK